MPVRAALVTGASSGIGLGLTSALCEDGFGVTMAARRPDKLTAAAAELRAHGYDVHTVAGDLGSEEVVAHAVAAHRDRYGRLDVLVNNAAWASDSTSMSSPPRRSTCRSPSTSVRCSCSAATR